MVRTILSATACLALAACQQTPEIVDVNKPAPACFSASDFRSWRAPDSKTMYVRAGFRDYYRVDLYGTCPALTRGNSFLITTFRGPATICSNLDWDLKVAETGGAPIAVPCIVEKMTPLTPAQAAEIPEKYRP
jgi:hypothetical protein